MSMETMLRGATNHRNFIIGGVVVQTERSTKKHICYDRFAHLIEYCYAIPLHEQDMSRIPYGRDPVFLVDSVRMMKNPWCARKSTMTPEMPLFSVLLEFRLDFSQVK